MRVSEDLWPAECAGYGAASPGQASLHSITAERERESWAGVDEVHLSQGCDRPTGAKKSSWLLAYHPPTHYMRTGL